MGPERNRRIAIVLIMSALLLLSSWLEDDDPRDSQSGVRSSVKSAARRLGRSLGALEDDTKKSKLLQQETSKLKRDYGHLLRDEEADDEHEDDDEAYFAKTFKGKSQIYIRTTAFHFDLHACLPKFICEIHAHHVSSDLTELEKDIIGLFRNYVVLEGPGSPVYTYQLAAHMGQLVTGLEPSPCQDLYPMCPLSRHQLLDILRNVKTSRRMFY
ncbi:uncharacterized protein [Macrobrachium rosenbergii]|uniref:uncharacterized protein n=1 Tax=Macrobrachium rosenbergii TaxID=79674 RepID=UPI0034D54C91